MDGRERIGATPGCILCGSVLPRESDLYFLMRELIERAPLDDVSPRVRRIMSVRSIATLCLFGFAAVVALKYPLVGLGLCCCCLIVYLKPDAPGGST